MKRRTVMTLTALVLILVAVPATFAARGHRGGHEGMGFGIFGKLHAIKSELGLTDAQVTDIHKIAESMRDENRQYRIELKKNMGAVAQVLIANPDNLTGAESLLDRQVATEQALKSNALRAASEALSVLTPEQRVKLGQMLAQRMSAE